MFHLIHLFALSAQIILTDTAPYRVQSILTATNRGDGGPAHQAILYYPSGIAEDSSGNVYVAESKANQIRRILPDGTIETYTTANAPTALLITPDQHLLYFDNDNCMIRKISPDRSVQDIAGSGLCALPATPGPGGFGGSGDKDGKALETTLGNIHTMIFDNEGRLTFTETSLHIVRRLNADGTLETISGQRQSGFSGDNEKAIDASFSSPTGLAIDGDGNLYIGDSGNCRVRRIDVTLYIETWVGSTSCASSTSTYTGSRNIAIERPGALVFDRAANALLIAQPRAYRVLRLNVEESRVVPLLGNGKIGLTIEESPLHCPINETGAMLLSPNYGLLVAAPSSFQIFSLKNAIVDRFAGQWPQNELLDPRGILTAQDGSLLLLDAGLNRLLRIEPEGKSTTLAGTTYPTGFSKGDNGPALDATLDAPTRLVQHPNGNIYIAEASRIRLLKPDGTLSTIRTSLLNPGGMVIDSAGRLIFSDSGNHRVMRIDLSTNIATRIAGSSEAGFSGDGSSATDAKLNNPGDLVIDAQGNLLIADRDNRRIRKVASDGKISTIAGNGLPFSYADITGELATRTGFGSIDGLSLDPSGNIYISEVKRLTRIRTNGRVEILTGYQSQADDGTDTYFNEQLDKIDAVAILPNGSLAFTTRTNPSLKSALISP
jgi:hypothetical protein